MHFSAHVLLTVQAIVASQTYTSRRDVLTGAVRQICLDNKGGRRFHREAGTQAKGVPGFRHLLFARVKRTDKRSQGTTKKCSREHKTSRRPRPSHLRGRNCAEACISAASGCPRPPIAVGLPGWASGLYKLRLCGWRVRNRASCQCGTAAREHRQRVLVVRHR